MKKTLFPLLLILILSGCDFDKLPGINTQSALPDNADFIALKGTRLKTFRMTPDPTQLEVPVTVHFSGTGTGVDSEPIYTSDPGGQHLSGWHYVTSGFTNSLSTTVPLAVILFPSDYIASFSGGIAYDWHEFTGFSGASRFLRSVAVTFNNLYSDFFQPINPDYLDYEPEVFTCDSYIVPENEYLADNNYFRIHNIRVQNISVSAAQLKKGNFPPPPYNYYYDTTYYFVDLSIAPFDYTVFYRQVSRGFYLYRSISVTFAPDIEVFGWQAHDGNISEIVDRFEFDPDTNTLTAYFKEYLDNTLGDVFSFYIIAEDGSVKLKTVSIGRNGNIN